MNEMFEGQAEDQKDQIDDLLDSIIGDAGGKEKEEEEDVVDEGTPDEEEGEDEEEVVEEEEAEDEKEAEEKDDSKDGEDEEEGEEEGEEENEEGEEEDVDEAEEFRQYINEMAKKQLGEDGKPKEKKKEKAEEKVDVKDKEEEGKESPTPAFGEEVALSDDDFDDVFESAENVNKKLIRPIMQAQQKNMQNLLTSISKNVSALVKDIVDVRMAASDFYQANPDLTRYKPTVSMVANEIFAQNPDADYDELFRMTGEEVRKRLRLSPGGANNARQPGNASSKSAIGKRKKTSRKPTPPKLSGLKGEIAELMDLD